MIMDKFREKIQKILGKFSIDFGNIFVLSSNKLFINWIARA